VHDLDRTWVAGGGTIRQLLREILRERALLAAKTAKRELRRSDPGKGRLLRTHKAALGRSRYWLHVAQGLRWVLRTLPH